MQGSTFFGNTLVAPRWAGDYLGREHLMPFGAILDFTQFTDSAGVPITVTASAIQTATSITIAALQPSLFPATTIIASGNVLIRSGSTISFGSSKFALLTTDAHVGDTTLTVASLPTALSGNETAVYSVFGTETIPSGTAVGRTLQMRNQSALWRPALVTDDEIYLVAFDLPNARRDNAATLYRHNSVVKENYLPGYAALTAGDNDVQTVTLTNTPTGGTFTLTFDGQTTTAIAYNATGPIGVQAALVALSTIGAGNVTVTGAASGPYVVTFTGLFAGADMDSITGSGASLTGGGSQPAVTVAHTTVGGNTSALLGKLRTLYQCILGVD
jgi:hypothetical protein